MDTPLGVKRITCSLKIFGMYKTLFLLNARSFIFNSVYVAFKNQFTSFTGVAANNVVNVLLTSDGLRVFNIVKSLFCKNS